MSENESVKTTEYPESVFAGFWIRFVAYITDLIIIGSIARLLRGPLLLVAGSDRISVWYFELTLAAMVFSLYFVLFTKFSKGQTLGKMIFGLKVVCFGEEQLSWQTVLVRELFGRYIQKTIILLYIIAAFTPKKQHAVDYLADTGVISESKMKIFQEYSVDEKETDESTVNENFAKEGI